MHQVPFLEFKTYRLSKQLCLCGFQIRDHGPTVVFFRPFDCDRGKKCILRCMPGHTSKNKSFMKDYTPLLDAMHPDISYYVFFRAAGNSQS